MGAKVFNGLLVVAALVGALWLPRPAHAQSLCATCEVQIGLGGTYHFWGTTGRGGPASLRDLEREPL
jgi:hypothetical protein